MATVTSIATTARSIVKSDTSSSNTSDSTTSSYCYPLSIKSEDFSSNFLTLRSLKVKASGRSTYYNIRNNLTTGSSLGFTTDSIINIYIPPFTESLSQSYDTEKFSMLGKLVKNAITNGTSMEGLKKTAAQSAGALVGSLTRAAYGEFNDSYEQQEGRIVSNNTIGSYKYPQRRTQTLNFRFAPESLNELKEVANIIKACYLGALPTRYGGDDSGIGDSFTSYLNAASDTTSSTSEETEGLVTYEIPDVWVIEEVSNSSYDRYTPPFVFGPAGLSNISLNRTPDQYWHSFKQTAGDPPVIELSLTFVELFAIDKKVYKNDIVEAGISNYANSY